MPKINCSYCKKDILYKCIKDIPTFPFCSKKCKLIDLGLWFNEEYKIENPSKSQIDDQPSK